MLGITLLVIAITIALPYTPLAGPLGFTPLPGTYLLSIALIVGLYFICAEITKRWFYKKYGA